MGMRQAAASCWSKHHFRVRMLGVVFERHLEDQGQAVVPVHHLCRSGA